jgi:hypothetical protein
VCECVLVVCHGVRPLRGLQPVVDLCLGSEWGGAVPCRGVGVADEVLAWGVGWVVVSVALPSSVSVSVSACVCVRARALGGHRACQQELHSLTRYASLSLSPSAAAVFLLPCHVMPCCGISRVFAALCWLALPCPVVVASIISLFDDN